MILRTSNRGLHSIPSLDGIRAIAVGFVLLDHYGDDLFGRDPFNFGDLGVRIFFVISGFLITTLLLKEIDRSGGISLGQFYFRRTLRIFPPFYFYLGVMLVISAFGLSGLTFSGALPALTYTSNYWSTFSSAGFTTSHTWSLATEEQFYLVWPLLLKVTGRKSAPLVLVVVLAASPLLRAYVYFQAGHPTGALDAFHLNADHIGAGCLLAFIRGRLQGLPRYLKIQGSRAFSVVPVFIIWASCQGNHPSVYTTVLRSLVNVSIALCIDWAVVNHAGLVGRGLNSRPLSWIGVLSYSIYLWQQPFSHLHREHPALNLYGGWHIIASPFVSLPCIAGCACFSYYLVERPSLRFRERLGISRRT